MKLNRDEPIRKSKPLALKYVAKTAKTSQVWESEEVSQVEGSEDVSDDKEMYFIIKRFQYLAKKNKRFSRRSSGFKGYSSREKKDDWKECFNCKKRDHFITDYPELQKDKSKKGRFQKDNLINKFKKSLMALASSEMESDSDSSSEFEEDDEVFYKLSCYDLFIFIRDLIGKCQDSSRHMKIFKKKYIFSRKN